MVGRSGKGMTPRNGGRAAGARRQTETAPIRAAKVGADVPAPPEPANAVASAASEEVRVAGIGASSGGAEKSDASREQLQSLNEELVAVNAELKALRETRDYYEKLLDYANAPIIVWDRDLRITRFNHAFERLTGRTAESVVGKKVEVLIPMEAREKVLEKIHHATAMGERWETVEIPVQHANGQVLKVLWNSATIHDASGSVPIATIAQGSDITERSKLEVERGLLHEEAADRLADLQTVLDNAPIAIWINRDPQSRVITGNRYANRLFGVEEGSNISRSAVPGEAAVSYRVLRNGRELKAEDLPVQAATATGKQVSPEEIQIVFEDGRRLFMLAGAVPLLDKEGNSRGAVAIGTDITMQKELMDVKDEFIGMVSHELRTPLTVVSSALKTALDERVSHDEQLELIREASASADSLANILDNMLELSRHQSGRLNLDKRETGIQAVVQRVFKRLEQQYPGRSLASDVPDDLPVVHVDPGRIERILFNLVENAVKYSPAGSEVRVRGRRVPGEVVIEVSDQGTGISPEDQKRLFEPFGRVESSIRAKGVGLGLLVCRRLVEAHGGRIWVESSPGAGSTFVFTIPQGTESGGSGQPRG